MTKMILKEDVQKYGNKNNFNYDNDICIPEKIN